MHKGPRHEMGESNDQMIFQCHVRAISWNLEGTFCDPCGLLKKTRWESLVLGKVDQHFLVERSLL